MNREEYDKIINRKKLNAWIAGNIMGWTSIDRENYTADLPGYFIGVPPGENTQRPIEDYAAYIHLAFMVLNMILKPNMEFNLNFSGGLWSCKIEDIKSVSTESASVVLCEAIKLYKEVKI